MKTNLDVSQWTMAPLQLTIRAQLEANIEAVFHAFSDPDELCRLFAWMHHIEVVNTETHTIYGASTKRRCHFGNGLVLEETIVGWWPPNGYAYLGSDEAHPFGMRGHLGLIWCESADEQTNLIWQHWFDHCDPAAMKERLNENIQAALQNFVRNSMKRRLK